MQRAINNRRINSQERAQITAEQIELFKRAVPTWYPCPANAEKLMNFLVSQIGSNEGPDPEYPYPYLLDNFQFAYDAICNSGDFFIARPESAAVLQVRADAEQARLDEEARIRTVARQPRPDSVSLQEAELRQLPANSPAMERALRSLPIADHKNLAVRQRNRLAGKRDTPVVNQESRPVTELTVSDLAAARARVALKHPHLMGKRESSEFTNLVQIELQKSRN